MAAAKIPIRLIEHQPGIRKMKSKSINLGIRCHATGKFRETIILGSSLGSIETDNELEVWD